MNMDQSSHLAQPPYYENHGAYQPPVLPGYFPLNCYTSLLPAPSPAHIPPTKDQHFQHQEQHQHLLHQQQFHHQPVSTNQLGSYEPRSYLQPTTKNMVAINLASDNANKYQNKIIVPQLHHQLQQQQQSTSLSLHQHHHHHQQQQHHHHQQQLHQQQQQHGSSIAVPCARNYYGSVGNYSNEQWLVNTSSPATYSTSTPAVAPTACSSNTNNTNGGVSYSNTNSGNDNSITPDTLPLTSYTEDTLKSEDKVKKKLVCNQCDFFTFNRKTLANHIARHTGQGLHACPHCPFNSAYLGTFKRHMIRKHNSKAEPEVSPVEKKERLKCPHCPFVTIYKKNMKKHIAKHTGEGVHKCEHCDYVTAYIAGFRKHMLKHAKDTAYTCPYCPYTSPWKGFYERHISSKHPDKKSFSCSMCSYIGTSKRSLKNHLLKHERDVQGNKSISKLNCSETGCSFTTDDPEALKEHSNKHASSSKQFHCNHCSYSTPLKGLFKFHLNTHAEEMDAQNISSQRWTNNVPMKPDLIHAHNVNQAYLPHPLLGDSDHHHLHHHQQQQYQHHLVPPRQVPELVPMFQPQQQDQPVVNGTSHVNNNVPKQTQLQALMGSGSNPNVASNPDNLYEVGQNDTNVVNAAANVAYNPCNVDACTNNENMTVNVTSSDATRHPDGTVTITEQGNVHRNESRNMSVNHDNNDTTSSHIPSCSFSQKSEHVNCFSNNIKTNPCSGKGISAKSSSPKIFGCKHCPFTTPEKNELRVHVSSHSGKELLSCPHCPFTTGYQGTLRRHMNTHTRVGAYMCPHCPYKSTWKGFYDRHVVTKHTEVSLHRCPYCEYTSPRKGTFKRHLDTHVKDEKLCNKKSLRYRLFQDKKDDGKYVCDHCEYSTDALASLKRHMVKHTKENSYVCLQCSYTVECQTTFHKHLQRHEASSVVARAGFSCTLCDFSTSAKTKLESHLQNQHSKPGPAAPKKRRKRKRISRIDTEEDLVSEDPTLQDHKNTEVCDDPNTPAAPKPENNLNLESKFCTDTSEMKTELRLTAASDAHVKDGTDEPTNSRRSRDENNIANASTIHETHAVNQNIEQHLDPSDKSIALEKNNLDTPESSIKGLHNHNIVQEGLAAQNSSSGYVAPEFVYNLVTSHKIVVEPANSLKVQESKPEDSIRTPLTITPHATVPLNSSVVSARKTKKTKNCQEKPQKTKRVSKKQQNASTLSGNKITKYSNLTNANTSANIDRNGMTSVSSSGSNSMLGTPARAGMVACGNSPAVVNSVAYGNSASVARSYHSLQVQFEAQSSNMNIIQASSFANHHHHESLNPMGRVLLFPSSSSGQGASLGDPGVMVSHNNNNSNGFLAHLALAQQVTLPHLVAPSTSSDQTSVSSTSANHSSILASPTTMLTPIPSIPVTSSVIQASSPAIYATTFCETPPTPLYISPNPIHASPIESLSTPMALCTPIHAPPTAMAPPTSIHAPPTALAPPTSIHASPTAVAPPASIHAPPTAMTPTSIHALQTAMAPPTSIHAPPTAMAPPTSIYAPPISNCAPPTPSVSPRIFPAGIFPSVSLSSSFPPHSPDHGSHNTAVLGATNPTLPAPNVTLEGIRNVCEAQPPAVFRHGLFF